MGDRVVRIVWNIILCFLFCFAMIISDYSAISKSINVDCTHLKLRYGNTFATEKLSEQINVFRTIVEQMKLHIYWEYTIDVDHVCHAGSRNTYLHTHSAHQSRESKKSSSRYEFNYQKNYHERHTNNNHTSVVHVILDIYLFLFHVFLFHSTMLLKTESNLNFSSVVSITCFSTQKSSWNLFNSKKSHSISLSCCVRSLLPVATL